MKLDCYVIPEILRQIQNTLLVGKMDEHDFRAEIGVIKLKSLFPNK